MIVSWRSMNEYAKNFGWETNQYTGGYPARRVHSFIKIFSPHSLRVGVGTSSTVKEKGAILRQKDYPHVLHVTWYTNNRTAEIQNQHEIFKDAPQQVVFNFLERFLANPDIPYRDRLPKVKLLLYDPRGILKSGVEYESEHDAWGSGENWKLLREGNTYKIEKENAA